MTPLNVHGKQFCERLGVAYNAKIMLHLRELNLVRFFKLGKKYMYPLEDVNKVNEKLLNGDISIKVNNGYYITLNE